MCLDVLEVGSLLHILLVGFYKLAHIRKKKGGKSKGICSELNISPSRAVAAAKSLQSCPTLCDPIDGSHQAPPSLGFSRQEQCLSIKAVKETTRY